MTVEMEAGGSIEVAPGVEVGSFVPLDRSYADIRRIVLATFNIRYAVGPYLITGGILRRLGVHLARPRTAAVRANIQSAAEALRNGDLLPRPDIIALQESDHSTARAGGVHIARELAEALEMEYVHAATKLPRDTPEKRKQWYLDFEEHIQPDDAGDTGVALLSRFPLNRFQRIDLPWQHCPWRPRLAVGAQVEVGGRTVTIYNSHIDPHAATGQQLAQHEKVLARADQVDGPVVLLGDFNTLTPRSRRETRRLLESRGFTTPFLKYTRTWRAGLYTQHADWIFVRGATVTRHGVARPLRVSDHWPVWAEVEL